MSDDLIDAATKAGVANFEATSGRVPDNFKLLAEHAPAAFAGYGLIRSGIMRDRSDGGALDLKTKELIFALLDTLIGQKVGARNHAANAIRAGLTLPELSEGLVQVIMAGGITTWNETGADVLRHCADLSGAGKTLELSEVRDAQPAVRTTGFFLRHRDVPDGREAIAGSTRGRGHSTKRFSQLFAGRPGQP